MIALHQTGRTWYTEHCLFNSMLSLKRHRLARPIHYLKLLVGPFKFMEDNSNKSETSEIWSG
jgi:hypothetical protein